MVVPLRSQARLWHSLFHWAYFGLFPPLAAAFVRPSPLHPFGGFDDYGLFRALRAAFVRPFSLREKGGFWAVLLHTVAPLSKRLLP